MNEHKKYQPVVLTSLYGVAWWCEFFLLIGLFDNASGLYR